jgi:hypothetical protein
MASERAVKVCLLVCVLVCSVTASARAAPRDRGSSAFVHGMFVGELGTAGVFALNFGTDLPDRYLVPVNFTPFLLAPAAAYGAFRAKLDPRPTMALHGALWFGADLFLLGALIDGRERAWQLRRGTVAWTLGGIGVLAGGLAGAVAIRDDDALLAWMIGPPIGFAAGGLVLGGVLVLAGGADGDDALGQFATGAIVGTTLGLGVAGVLAYSDHRATRRLARFVPHVTPGSDRVVVSFGGTW